MTIRPDRRAASMWLLPAPAVFFCAWGGNHFTVLLHLYEQLGGYRAWQVNLLLGTYVAGLIPGLLVASAISDRYGRKPVLIAGTAASILASALLGAALHDFVLLCAGRALAGAGVGVAMSVGTSWIKELSSPPFDPHAGTTAGARRPSLTLTLGFGLGAAATGALAQWAPDPAELPYVVHGLLATASLVVLLWAPESLPREARSTEHPWWHDLRIPSVGHRRFTGLVLPAAPWVFAAAGVAYAVMPSIVDDKLGRWDTLYATALTVITLGTGALVQNAVPRINRATHGRGLVVGLTVMFGGMLLAVVASIVRSPVLALFVAVTLGAAYGICIVAGLIHVQAIATANDLAGLTGVYYSLSYAGFLLPTILALALPVAPYSVTLGCVAGICLVSLGLVTRNSRGIGRTREPTTLERSVG